MDTAKWDSAAVARLLKRQHDSEVDLCDTAHELLRVMRAVNVRIVSVYSFKSVERHVASEKR